MPAAPAPLILNFWCLKLVIAELILCDKAVPAANEFLFPAWGQLSFSSILKGRTVSWRSQIIWPILNMTKCSLLEWLFPTERVLCQVEPEGNNAMKSLVYSWSFFSVPDSDLSATLVSLGPQKSDQVHSRRALLGWFPWHTMHTSLWLWSWSSFSLLKSGNRAAAERLDSVSWSPAVLSSVVHSVGCVVMWFPVFQELQLDSKI